MNALRDMGTALRLLTVLPAGSHEGLRPARYFPWVGVVFSLTGLGIAWTTARVLPAEGAASLMAGTLIVGVWALLSGGMHWDGLADSLDGLGVRGDSARRLTVMRESGIGAYGALGLVVCLVAQVSAIAVLLEVGALWPIAAAPVLGRLGASAALVWRRPARPDGLGARYAVDEGPFGAVIMALPILALVGLWYTHGHAGSAVAGLVTAVVAPSPFARRLGGVTGDVAGASVIITETVVLIAGVLAGTAL
ncbi:MAG: adenosylcobinamide-GDP ribazoletransferase [Aeromicrobium sp.]|nr:adenosylcobinamide-GDP ribazoletransferase [Aeromicrobium sp.]